MKKTTAFFLIILLAVTLTAADSTKILKKLRKQVDKETTMTWYYSRLTPSQFYYAGTSQFPYNNTMFYIYLVIPAKEKPFLRLYVQLEPTGNWINFDQVTITAGQESYRLKFPAEERRTEVFTSSRMIEYYDIVVIDEVLQILEKIAPAKDITLQFTGPKGSTEKKVKDKELKAIREILTAYKAVCQQ